MAAMQPEDIVLNRIFGQGAAAQETNKPKKRNSSKRVYQQKALYSPNKPRKSVNKPKRRTTDTRFEQKEKTKKQPKTKHFYDSAMEFAERKNIPWPEVIKRSGFYKSKLHMMKKNKIRPDLGDLITLCIVLDMSKNESIKYLRTAGYILSSEYVLDKAYGKLLDMQPRLSIPECNDYLAQEGITKKDFLGNKKRNSQTNIFDVRDW